MAKRSQISGYCSFIARSKMICARRQKGARSVDFAPLLPDQRWFAQDGKKEQDQWIIPDLAPLLPDQRWFAQDGHERQNNLRPSQVSSCVVHIFFVSEATAFLLTHYFVSSQSVIDHTNYTPSKINTKTQKARSFYNNDIANLIHLLIPLIKLKSQKLKHNNNNNDNYDELYKN